MKKILISVLFVISIPFSYQTLFAQSSQWLNPGIKLGYTFGAHGGFIWGLEVSYTFVNKSFFWGPLIDVDFCKDRVKTHVGIEGFFLLAGVDIGPTWISEKGKTKLGYSIIPFTGLVIIPYYNLTFIPGKSTLREIGSYLKIPILRAGGL